MNKGVYINIGKYTLTTIIEKGLTFLLIPVVAALVSQEDLARFFLFLSIGELLIPIGSVSLDSYYLFRYFRQDALDSLRVFNLILKVPVLIFLMLLVVGLPIIICLKSIEVELYAAIMVYSIGRYLVQVLSSKFRFEDNSNAYMKLLLGIALMKNTIPLILLSIGYSWHILIYVYAIIYVVSALFVLLRSKFNWHLCQGFDYKELTKAFKYSYPLTIHKFNLWLGSEGYRWIIATFISLEISALYGVAAMAGTVYSTLEDSVNKAVAPLIYKASSQEGVKSQVLMSRIRFVLVFAGVLFGVAFFLLIPVVFDDSYVDSRKYIGFILLAAIIRGIYKIDASRLISQGGTWMLTKTSAIANISGIIGAFVLVRYLAIYGILIGILIASIIQLVLIKNTTYLKEK